MRGGYGAAAITLAKRGASVVIADRDLLALTYARINGRTHGVMLEERPALWLPDALTEPFKLVVGELSSSAGDDVARAEMQAATTRLPARSEVLWLTLTKHASTWLQPVSPRDPVLTTRLATRGAWSVLRMSPRGA